MSSSEPTPEPVPEPTPEPVSEPTPEPVSEPTPEPVSEPTPEPVSEPTPEPVSEPTPEPVSEPVSEPVVDPTPAPAPVPIADGSTDFVSSTAYDTINRQINGMLSTNRQAFIDIYDDVDGTIFTLDSNGNQISSRQVKSVSMTKSYIDSVTNAPVSASVFVVFNDNSTFKAIDDDHLNWYRIGGDDFPLRAV
jgi:hypothetical protein